MALALSACGSDDGALRWAEEVQEIPDAAPKEKKPSVDVGGSAPTSQYTRAEENAIKSAESYLSFMNFSRQGLIDQLSSEYGEGFTLAQATLAVDSLHVDFMAEAAESAEGYLSFMSFSCQGLIDQLSSEYGEGFTMAQARHGAGATGIC